MMPAIVVAIGCRRIGNSRKTAENTAGISVPPAKPCSTRKPTSIAKLPLDAQPIEAIVKRPTAATNSHRKVSTRVSHPVNGIATISAIRYAVWIQLMASGEIASACWIAGSDVATTWMSRIAMNMPRHIRTKPNHVAALGSAACSAMAWSLMLHRECAVFGADPDRKDTRIEDRKDRSDPWQVQNQRKHGDLACHHGIIGMRQISIGTGRHQALSREHDDPRRPSRAQRPEHPAAQALEHEIGQERDGIHRLVAPKYP